MPKSDHRVPPGPRGLALLQATFSFSRNPLDMLTGIAREYGDIVLLRFPLNHRILLSNPTDIEQVLVVDHQKFHKGIMLKHAAQRLLGQGLLLSEGEFWRRQRRLAQPAFQRARTVAHAPVMAEYARAHVAPWRDGEVRDIVTEMLDLTSAIAVKTLFGVELKSEAVSVGRALQLIVRHEFHRLRWPVRLPVFLPTPQQKRIEEAYRYLDSIVFRIIDERRKSAEPGNDLLSMLLHAVDEDGSQMTPQQLRDETMTLFLAGHETTALTLAWTWYLLSENLRTELCLHEELARVLGGRAPEADDLARLSYLTAVIQESLRLFPPAYVMGRTSIEPFQVRGYAFKPGTTVIFMPWILHRDPRYFDEPLVFRPERWLDGLAHRLPNYSYFPFGAGPRRCIGEGFALMEAALVAATIAQRFRFRLVADHRVVPEPLITLHPKFGMRMTVTERR
jgi:cytochrome P450